MIVEDYIAGRSIVAMTREYGIGERRIYGILKEAGVKKRPPGPEKCQDPLTAVHARIGKQVYDFYYDKGLSRVEAAKELGMTPQALRRIEIGRHPLELFDLQDLSSFMGVEIGELINGS